MILADGYFPDRQNCRVYHICTSGVDTASVCAEGTAWDPIKRNCAWENTVECKKGLRRWDQITDIRGGLTEIFLLSLFKSSFGFYFDFSYFICNGRCFSMAC